MTPNPLADLGAGLNTKTPSFNPHPGGPIQHGTPGQVERAFTAASTFFSGMLAISASQFLGAPLKAIDPKFYEAYMAFTKQSFGVLITTMTQWWSPTVVRVSGDTSIPKQLFRKQDGGLECRFPKRLVMMANHQLYTDWLYLWWVAYTNNMHGYVYIILKESLKNVPILGWGAQFYNFIFLSRKWEQDQAQFQEHLDQLNVSSDPMWLLIFPEGTNLANGTRERSKLWADKNKLQDMKHQLLPRSRGLQFCLQRLRDSTDWLYDVTIGYEGVPAGKFGQDIFTLRSSMLEGRPPKSVNMHFRRFKIANIPIDNDKAFEVWLRNRWREKDYLLEHFARFNRFPSSHDWMSKQRKAGQTQLVSQTARTIETQIKSNSIEEFLSIFAPLTSVLTIIFLLSGGVDPAEAMQMLKNAGTGGKDKVLRLQNTLSKGLQQQNGETSSASLEEIERRSPSLAQKELIQRYLNSVKPAAAAQISLSKNALMRPSISMPKPSQRKIVSIAGNGLASRRSPSVVSAPVLIQSLPPLESRSIGKQIAKLGAATKPVIGRQVTTKPPPTSILRPASITAETKPLPAKAFKSTPSTSNAAIAAATQEKKAKENRQPGKTIKIEPKVLAKMKGIHSLAGPVSIDSDILAKMKAPK